MDQHAFLLWWRSKRNRLRVWICSNKKLAATPTAMPAKIPIKLKIGKYNITVQDCAIQLATTSCPTLCKIPPAALMPIIDTRFSPSCLINNMPNHDNTAPAPEYKNVDSVPPSKVVNTNRNNINKKLSEVDIVNSEIMVIKLARPSLAPGAKAKGKGIMRSSKPMITPCAQSNAMKMTWRVRSGR